MQTSNKVIFSFFLLFSLIVVSSCKKNELGGDATLHAMIFHGTTPIVGTTTLYVKYGAKSQPANPTTDFDEKVQGEPDDNHVHVEGLRYGDYYLYAVAFDSIAMVPVHGGAAASIKWSERKKTIDVPIQTTN